MVADPPLERRLETLDTTDFDKELTPFVCAFCQLICSYQPIRVFTENRWIAMLDHMGTGTGGDDNRTRTSFKCEDGMLCHQACLIPEASVVGGLSATCLPIRYTNLEVFRLKGGDDGLVGISEETVYETGTQQLDGV